MLTADSSCFAITPPRSVKWIVWRGQPGLLIVSSPRLPESLKVATILCIWSGFRQKISSLTRGPACHELRSPAFIFDLFSPSTCLQRNMFPNPCSRRAPWQSSEVKTLFLVSSSGSFDLFLDLSLLIKQKRKREGWQRIPEMRSPGMELGSPAFTWVGICLWSIPIPDFIISFHLGTSLPNTWVAVSVHLGGIFQNFWGYK